MQLTSLRLLLTALILQAVLWAAPDTVKAESNISEDDKVAQALLIKASIAENDRLIRARRAQTIDQFRAELEEINWSLLRRYELIKKEETTCETFLVEDAELVVVAFGIAARIAKGAIKTARTMGLKVGLLRPITLWPFPAEKVQELAKRIKYFLVFEMNMGQMVEDVQLSLGGAGEVAFYGRPGGVIPTPSEVVRVVSRLYYQKGLK